MNAVNQTLEAYGAPTADIELSKRTQEGSCCSVANPFGESAACAIEKEMKQGDPTHPPSPNNYLTLKDSIIRTLSASGCGWHPPTQEHSLEGQSAKRDVQRP